MKKIIICLILSLGLLNNVFAITSSDSWDTPDKSQHIAAGALIGSSVTLLTHSEKEAFINYPIIYSF